VLEGGSEKEEGGILDFGLGIADLHGFARIFTDKEKKKREGEF
jgi:hypothetical protein